MPRLISLKSFIALVIVGLGLTILIMSRSTFNKKATAFNSPDLQEDIDMHYYSNHRDPVKEVKAVDISKAGKEIVDYPFEDHVETNDFDPLSAPGEENLGNDKALKPLRKPSMSKSSVFTDVTCDVNSGKFMIDCKKGEDDEVYVPFSFLHKYFEVFGKMSDTKADTFLWSHSAPIKIYRPKQRYDPEGVFAFFENYNVEVRDRVKCISGSTGVPVSTQWDVNGYFYPIQIAQFGLSHYSKYVTEKSPIRVIVANGRDVKGKWIPPGTQQVKSVPDPDNPNRQVIAIKATGVIHDNALDTVTQRVKLSLDTTRSQMLILSLDIRSISRDKHNGGSTSNITLTVKVRYESQEFFLHYVTGDFYIKVQDKHIFHGLGNKSQRKWHHIVRNIGVDLEKGIGFSTGGRTKKKSQKVQRSKIILDSLSISNVNSFDIPLLIDNITLANTEHLSQFFQAVDWFVENQDGQGGWSIPVARKFHQNSNFYPMLRPGWYSAMGQGHGLSLLSRAYALTKDSKYSLACEKALKSIFDHSGTDNLGVRAMFMDEYVWYEEYPTTPSSFVLNGFIYSLLGLYDVQTLRIPGATEKARKLYNEGMRSLVKMLPLYDTGSGTFYDLRHFTVPGIAPNLARLDYHVTHINQLLILASINEDPIFETTAARWIQYSQGERAPHN